MEQNSEMNFIFNFIFMLYSIENLCQLIDALCSPELNLLMLYINFPFQQLTFLHQNSSRDSL